MAKKTKQAVQPEFAGESKEFFGLPRTISKEIRQCAAAHAAEGPAARTVRYLWINIADHVKGGDSGEQLVPKLNFEDWLNVIDEAASVGICCVVICTGDGLQDNQDLWTICQWAQRVHGLDVGIHARCTQVRPQEVEELQRLDLEHTWLFVTREAYALLRDLESQGIRVRVADVCREDHRPPCDMPESLVFVGPEGSLYTCGLVLGNDEYRLGHVMEKPLNHVIADRSLPRFVPESAPYRMSGCDACPPIMADRMAEEGGHTAKV
ncbi:MAG: hypothetical protein NTU83_04525 [Candidatus Hydrogenedentes bacterium]|nr:hypothetical protein [Candidatus Hydrogenedentota bacterium]